MRMLTIRRAFLYISSVGFILLVADLSGIHRHLFEKDYDTQFSYPLELESSEFKSLVQKYRNREGVTHDPINEAATNLIFMNKADTGCASETYRLILLVKSAPRNFERRAAIRETWGYPKRFSDVPIKTVFLLGFEKDLDNDNPLHEREEKEDTSLLDEAVEKEITKYNDIILADFHDNEDNSTIKTNMGLRWLVDTCNKFRFAMFVNDGMYVSVKNVLKFVRHPAEYPKYWEEQKKRDEKRLNNALQRSRRSLRVENSKHRLLNHLESDWDLPKMKSNDDEFHKQAQPPPPVLRKPTKVWKNHPMDFQIDMPENTILYSGHVISRATPRHKLGTKYYLPLEEYSFNKLPPYVSTEAILLSKSAVLDIHYASLYTKYLRLDDIFLGICAKKMGIEPFHSEYFHLDPTMVHDPYGKEDFKYVITANNFDDPGGLKRFWSNQKSMGNA